MDCKTLRLCLSRRLASLLAAAVLLFASPAQAQQAGLLVILVGGWDSEPTPEQIAGTATRGRGNSGLFQLEGDLRDPRVTTEYFNWNGTRAGEIKSKQPPHSRALIECIQTHLDSKPADRIAMVGNSWGGHTAWDACDRLFRSERPIAVDMLVTLDPSSAIRGTKTPKSLPGNVNSAINYFTRNAFVWGRLNDSRCLNIDLGDNATGFLRPGHDYKSLFNFQAHVAAEWDSKIHDDIRRRVLDCVP